MGRAKDSRAIITAAGNWRRNCGQALEGMPLLATANVSRMEVIVPSMGIAGTELYANFGPQDNNRTHVVFVQGAGHQDVLLRKEYAANVARALVRVIKAVR